MNRTKLLVNSVVIATILFLIGYAVFQQNQLLELGNKNNELNSHLEEQMTDLESAYGLLNSTYNELLRNYYLATGSLSSTICFDKKVYFPDAKVFSDANTLVPIDVIVVDSNVKEDYVVVRISCSVESKQFTLTKESPDVFRQTIYAVGSTTGKPVSDSRNLNVQYGDMMTAEYFSSEGAICFAAARFEFPMYIMNSGVVSMSFQPWKPLDPEGVPLVNYGSTTGVQYNPSIICSYAIANYQMYLFTQNATFRQAFLVQANWLVRNAVNRESFSVWEYRFDWPYGVCNATDPLVSALAQGEGLSVLTRAYALTGNRTYIEIADQAMHSFEVDMSLGGVRYVDSNGVWYEEIADVGARSAKVLNGFLYALFGLYEYYYETDNSRAYQLFLEGVDTLSSNLYRYDTGSWSYYDLLHFGSSPIDYHKTHIAQLRTLYEITKLDVFLAYSDKFQSYIH